MLNKLTISKAQAKELMEAGINCAAILYFGQDGIDVVPGAYLDGSENAIPAWTKEELDTMIGPDLPKPDFWESERLGKTGNPLDYPVYFPKQCKIYSSGAQAAADVLLFLIEKAMVDPFQASKRWRQKFE